jgi:hypothetical protein
MVIEGSRAVAGETGTAAARVALILAERGA